MYIRKLTLFATALLLSAACSMDNISLASGIYMDGVYEAAAPGKNGDVPVTVTISGGEIVSVDVGENRETDGIGTNAIDIIPQNIVEANSTDVDAQAGATVTSNAIKKAVDLALEKASSASVEKSLSSESESSLPEENIISDNEIAASEKHEESPSKSCVEIKSGSLVSTSHGVAQITYTVENVSDHAISNFFLTTYVYDKDGNALNSINGSVISTIPSGISLTTDIFINIQDGYDSIKAVECTYNDGQNYNTEKIASGEAIKLKEEAKNIQIYNQDGITVSVIGYEPGHDSYKCKVRLEIENLTHHDISFSAKESLINGINLEHIGCSINVNSGKKSVGEVCFWKKDTEEAGIEKVSNITLDLKAIDSTNIINTIADIPPVSLDVTADRKLVQRIVYRDADTIKEVQQMLNDAGYNCGAADGIPGKNTNSMILQFERDHDLDESTEITDELLEALRHEIAG